MILCVIPARGGSKGLPRKNIMPLLEKPLIGYTIEAAKTERILDRIVVSTEDPEIAKISKTFGVQVIDRPKDMSKDESNIDEALKHAVNMIEKEGKSVDIVVWLKANVPIRKQGQIQEVVNKLIESEADSVITIRKTDIPVEMACKLNDEILISYSGNNPKYPGRQEYPQSYYHSGSIYAIRKNVLMREKIGGDPGYFFGDKRIGFIVNEYQYNIEIDDQKDAIICELFMQRELTKNK